MKDNDEPYENIEVYFAYKQLQTAAMMAVKEAVDSGQIPAVAISRTDLKSGKRKKVSTEIPCEDCGKPSMVYDHRDYFKPLDVVPVCFSCNSIRGLAIITIQRLNREVMRGMSKIALLPAILDHLKSTLDLGLLSKRAIADNARRLIVELER